MPSEEAHLAPLKRTLEGSPDFFGACQLYLNPLRLEELELFLLVLTSLQLALPRAHQPVAGNSRASWAAPTSSFEVLRP